MNKAEIDKIADKLSENAIDLPNTSMHEVNAILKMTAKKRGCKVSDLQWRKDRFGAIHVRRKEEK